MRHLSWSSHKLLPLAAVALCLCGAAGAQEDGDASGSVLHIGGTLTVRAASRQTTKVLLQMPGVKSGQLVLELNRPDVAVHVLSPDGKTLREVSSNGPGTMLLSFAAAAAGVYRVELDTPAETRVTLRLETGASTKHELSEEMAAEDLYASAQSLHAKPVARDVSSAIGLFQQAGRAWKAQGNEYGEFLALTAEGSAWLDLSQYERSFRCYAAAGPLTAGHGDWQAELLNDRAAAYLDWWKSDMALPLAEQALQISRRENDPHDEAVALALKGEANYLQSASTEGWADLTQAMQIAQRLDDTATIARILRAESWVKEDLGELSKALELMRESEQTYREVGDQRSSFEDLADIATDDEMTGDLYSALRRHKRLLELIRATGQVSYEAYTTETLGVDYAELHKDHEAIFNFRKAYQLFQTIHHVSGEQSSTGDLCSSEVRLQMLSAAYNDCKTSLALSLQMIDPKREAITELRLGEVASALHHVSEARTLLERAAKLSASVKDPRFGASSLMDLAKFDLDNQRFTNALALYTKALGMSSHAEDTEGVIHARFGVAEVKAGLGQFDEAKSELDVAISLSEDERARVSNDQLRTSFFADLRKCYELYVDILMMQDRKTPGAGFDTLALEKSEAGRARALFEAISADKGSVPGSQGLNESPEIRVVHDALNRAYEKRLNLMQHSKDQDALTRNVEETRQLIARYTEMQDGERPGSAVPAPLPKPLSAVQLLAQNKLSDDVVLEYSLGDERSYLWKIEHGAVSTYVLPGRAVITDTVKQWRDLMMARQEGAHMPFEERLRRVAAADRALPQVSARLSCILLGGLRGVDGARIRIVGDGILQTVPFSALPVDGCNATGGAPMVTKFEIENVPSISALVAADKAGASEGTYPSDVAIFADPVFSADDERVQAERVARRRATKASSVLMALRDVGPGEKLPRLAGSREEAEAIASLVPADSRLLALDFDASRKTALSGEMAKYRIWHFATHGLLDATSPDLSGLVLSLVDADGKPTYGYLHLQDIFGMTHHPELVVLSACSSGLGEQIDGEGTVGLSYAFLHAGTKQVVSTLWNVDDQASGTLMKEFYRAMLQDKHTPSAALRGSQLLLLQKHATAAPFYWAGFSITSDAR